MKRTTVLRELIDGKEILTLVGGACALHAKIIEAVGFKAAYMSGGMTNALIFGLPDAGLSSLTEIVTNARYMANAINIPLVADADNGFGNANSVWRTVQLFARAGVAGVHIEDQASPRRCGFTAGKELIPIEEAVGKYRAAMDAKNELDPDFVIIARTDAMTAAGGGLNEVVRRLQAYKRDANVDVLYFEGPKCLDDIKAVRAAVVGPLMCSTRGLTPEPSIGEQSRLGLSVAFFPSFGARAGMVGCWDALADLKQRGTPAALDFEARTAQHPLGGLKIFDLVGFPAVRDREERYLPREALSKYTLSEGLYDASRKSQRQDVK